MTEDVSFSRFPRLYAHGQVLQMLPLEWTAHRLYADLGPEGFTAPVIEQQIAVVKQPRNAEGGVYP